MNNVAASHAVFVAQGDRIPTPPGFPLSVEVLFGAELTEGRFSLVRFTAAPGFAAPPVRHCHTRDGCWWYVLSGAIELDLVDGVRRVEAGQAISTGPGVAFAWRNASNGATTFLAVYSPAGFERYFVDAAQALAARDGEPLPAAMQAVIPPLWAKYGIEQRP